MSISMYNLQQNLVALGYSPKDVSAELIAELKRRKAEFAKETAEPAKPEPQRHPVVTDEMKAIAKQWSEAGTQRRTKKQKYLAY